MSKVITEFKKIKKEMSTLRKESQERCKAAFHEGAMALFEVHPELKKFSWRQYTPYFNDGDTCTFSVCRDAEAIDVNDVEDSYEVAKEATWDGNKSTPIPPNERHPLHAAQAAVAEFLNIFDEEDLQDAFGDHAEVVVTRKGVKVESYQHD